jgi:GT2 family glycosyltransferase
MPPPVTVIVLTWNGLVHTRRCLESLRRLTAFDGYEVLVVDNGSTDSTPEYVASLGGIRLIRNDENLGFVRGNNVGIRHSDPDSDVVLLNNDVEITQADWLARLQATAYSDPAIGVVGCRQVLPDGLLLHAGTYMPVETLHGQQIGSLEVDVNQYQRTRDVEGIVFACAYLKRAVLQRVGLLDDDYVSYFEDSDYCLKARAAGFRVVCCGDVTLVHNEHGSTRENKTNLSPLLDASRQIFRRKWQSQLEARYELAAGWHSIMNVPTGYGTTCRHLLLALDRAGVRPAYRYAYGPGSPHPVDEPSASGHYLLDVIRGRRLDRRAPQVVYAQGDVFVRVPGSPRVGYTMLEVDGVPAEWVRQANQMDEVWVPSTFNRDTFVKSGVTRPVHVMPLGIDPDYLHPGIRAERLPDYFVFLTIFEWSRRKAPELLLRAFNAEFKASERVVLLCKANYGPQVDIDGELEALRLDPRGGRIVFLDNAVLPHYQLGVLYRSSDCFVLASRGEGWAVPVLEAMACGVPSIVTDWGAQRDFISEATAFPLRVTGLVEADQTFPYYRGFKWAEPDVEHLRQLLRHAASHPELVREKGRRAAEEAHARWTWAHSAARIRERLRALTGRHG